MLQALARATDKPDGDWKESRRKRISESVIDSVHTASEHLGELTTTQTFSVSDFDSQSVLNFKRLTFAGLFLARALVMPARENACLYKTSLFREEYAPKEGRQIDARRPAAL